VERFKIATKQKKDVPAALAAHSSELELDLSMEGMEGLGGDVEGCELIRDLPTLALDVFDVRCRL